MRHYIRVTAGPYRGQIYQFDTKKDAVALERALNQLRPNSTDYGNDRDYFPETHLKDTRASTHSPLREVRAQLRTSDRSHATIVGASSASSKRSQKTKLVYVVQGNYGYGHGWEDLTAEENGNEARARLREYRENERGTPFRLVRRRERIASASGAHATMKTAGDFKVGDAVQFRWEPGTGGVIRRLDADAAWVATPCGERKVPADALRRVRKEHEERVRRAAGAAHAKRKKLDPREAKQLRKSEKYLVKHSATVDGYFTNEKAAAKFARSISEQHGSAWMLRVLAGGHEMPIARFENGKRAPLSHPGSSHARKKKLDPREAKQLLKSDGIDFQRDFHELGSQEVQRILEVARLAGYRKRRDAPGSTARMYFQYLNRQP